MVVKRRESSMDKTAILVGGMFCFEVVGLVLVCGMRKKTREKRDRNLLSKEATVVRRTRRLGVSCCRKRRVTPSTYIPFPFLSFCNIIFLSILLSLYSNIGINLL